MVEENTKVFPHSKFLKLQFSRLVLSGLIDWETLFKKQNEHKIITFIDWIVGKGETVIWRKKKRKEKTINFCPIEKCSLLSEK